MICITLLLFFVLLRLLLKHFLIPTLRPSKCLFCTIDYLYYFFGYIYWVLVVLPKLRGISKLLWPIEDSSKKILYRELVLASFQDKNLVRKWFYYTKSCPQIGFHASMIRWSFFKDYIAMKSYAGLTEVGVGGLYFWLTFLFLKLDVNYC